MGRPTVVVMVLALAFPALAQGRARPHAFASCAGLVGYAQRHFADTRGVPSRPVTAVAPPVMRPGPPQQGAPQAAAPTAAEGAGTTFSTTNNQEEGVDEPDVVKTDGKTVFAIAGTRLNAVSLAAGEPRLGGAPPPRPPAVRARPPA